MRNFLSKEHYCYKTHILIMKCSVHLPLLQTTIWITLPEYFFGILFILKKIFTYLLPVLVALNKSNLTWMNNYYLAGLSHLSAVGNFRTMLDRKMLNHANLSMKKYERT